MINTKLYKVDSKGKIREWFITVVDKDTHASIITTAGLQDGKKVETIIDFYEGKNIGKSNATTYFEQAIMDATSSAEHKLRGEYRLDISDASKGELRGGRAPMLAQKYHPEGAESGSKTLTKMGIEYDVIHVQPKLDGLRCIATVNETEVKLRTRGGDAFEPIPHIEAEFRTKYDIFNLTGEYEFDGELYSTEITFSEISGTLRKQKKTEEHINKLKYVKFHVYDTMSSAGYGERYKFINSIFGHKNDACPIQLIPSYEIVATDENILLKMRQFLDEGNEGLMIRTLDTPYANKRDWQLCKFKFFLDEEYELFDILPEKRGDIVGTFVMKAKAPYLDRNGKMSETFGTGTKDLTHAEGAEMLKNKHLYIGKQATIRFLAYTDYGIPLMGKFVGIREDL